ncbi:twin-arginine translocation signal domain-containing protein [Azospirillum brasilense]|uniref:twin-arginine translocation signal domain-containing protein n=1 Tax=Azospirillum brasilense TaxID=192 RepID=UPI000E68663D|nr:twin-arginine translocation signal domain-containing protein [Azospirillum brasilense]NUB24312.1 twin-arginine translocation signal domain-containing protein [Azospirillum brasilense]NUB34116.1 twin-arginine translocation signal domain-containing protein [Azospirillum brasilense]RIW00995.1 twin-arginine translocation signal domain-containing protein [Azospirillum brasilense]
MNTNSRRQFLTNAATLPVAAAVASVPLVARGATANPDTDLLAAAARAGEIYNEMNHGHLDDDVPDEVLAEYQRLVSVIAALPAHTADGVTAKLLFFTYEVEGCQYSYVAPGRTEGLLPQFIRTALEGAQRLTASALPAAA